MATKEPRPIKIKAIKKMSPPEFSRHMAGVREELFNSPKYRKTSKHKKRKGW